MSTPFDEILSASSPEVKAIAHAARDTILMLHPDAEEVIWEKPREAGYGFGPKKLSEHHTRLLLNKDYVTLMLEHGVRLLDQDTDKVLEGAGAKCRHIKLRNVFDASSESTKRMISIAIEDLRSVLEG